MGRGGRRLGGVLMPARIALILNGRHNDRGFVQEGYEGALRARDELGFDLEIIEFHRKDAAALEDLVAASVARGADGVIVHGSRADAAVEAVAARNPRCRFLSPGGRAEGDNVWNYAIRHFEAAYLGGVLAGRMTRTGTVGHLSGVFISPGKKGRAAYVSGVRDAAPEVQVLTGFCGDQDDPYLADRWMDAQAEAGADIVFTMLNYGRSGAIAACRRRGIRQIGNIRDWTAEDPEVFLGSVLSRHGWSIRAWIEDFLADRLETGRNRHPGLEVPEAVGLSLAADVPMELRAELDAVRADIAAGRRKIALDYDGPEFAPGDITASA